MSSKLLELLELVVVEFLGVSMSSGPNSSIGAFRGLRAGLLNDLLFGRDIFALMADMLLLELLYAMGERICLSIVMKFSSNKILSTTI